MRRWAARMLCPEVFEDERRLSYLCRRLDELDQWCGYGFPEIRAAVEWVRKSERIHFVSLPEYDAEVARAKEANDYSSIMGGNIDKFREEITDRFDRRPERA